jgi:serine/threonine protein kinase
MRLLCIDPAKRISMKEALKHGYFGDLTSNETGKYMI